MEFHGCSSVSVGDVEVEVEYTEDDDNRHARAGATEPADAAWWADARSDVGAIKTLRDNLRSMRIAAVPISAICSSLSLSFNMDSE